MAILKQLKRHMSLCTEKQLEIFAEALGFYELKGCRDKSAEYREYVAYHYGNRTGSPPRQHKRIPWKIRSFTATK